MQASPSTQRWRGEEKIVLGIDIGTTFTAIAYAYLYSNGPQVVKRVSEWPGQRAHRYESKVPTIVWYDRNGRAQSFCAEARQPVTVARAEREGWYLAEQFKMHVHPSTMASHYITNIIPLPPQVTVEQIYADILGYIMQHTRKYFEDKEFEMEGGMQIWRKLQNQNRIQYIICHPSGWGLQEQTMLRQATMRAGLINSLADAQELVQFVSEAEASVHFVMFHADLQSRLMQGTEFAICDAGGSTIDTTVYTVSSVMPSLTLRETRDSACIQAGGIFVDQSAREAFQKKFYDGRIDPDQVKEYVDTAMDGFIAEVKPSFENPGADYHIAVADRQVTQEYLQIERGYLTMNGYEIEGFFKTWVDQIVESIQQQIGTRNVRYVLLVGGFGESPYLRGRLRNAPNLRHVQFTVPEQSGAKAASEGSVLWTMTKSVVARAPRFAFGVTVLVPCHQQLASQLGRPIVFRQDGSTGVAGGWSEIVPKGHVIDDDAEISRSYERQYDSPSIDGAKVRDTIYMYDPTIGNGGAYPPWVRGPFGELLLGFQEVCTIEIDLSSMRGALRKIKLKSRGCCEPAQFYWVLSYRIAFMFGSTEIRAFVVWTENGETKSGPATLIPVSSAL